jgi:hypothetical protein
VVIVCDVFSLGGLGRVAQPRPPGYGLPWEVAIGDRSPVSVPLAPSVPPGREPISTIAALRATGLPLRYAPYPTPATGINARWHAERATARFHRVGDAFGSLTSRLLTAVGFDSIVDRELDVIPCGVFIGSNERDRPGLPSIELF